MSDWYKSPLEEVARKLNSDPGRGLEDPEVANRLEQYGPNELVERGAKTPWAILADQFKDTMVIILIFAAIISGAVGDLKDTLAILAIVLINALLGFRQEYQAEQAMAALKKLAVPLVRVRRGSHVKEISARELVPGDAVLLEAGNVVPADCRLVESANLRAQEAALTGESEPVEKDASFQADKDLPLADRRNMVYMGTVISYGRGIALVTDTGMKTELGSIAELLQTAGSEATPLQKRLDQLGKGLALAALVLVGVVFVMGLLRGEDVRELLLTAISLAVAAVPEGLPAVVTIALSLGARRMLNRNALIRKLPAVETLGSVTVICSDKTGTLTENRMTVTVVDVANHRIDLNQDGSNLPLHRKDDPCVSGTPDEAQATALRQNSSLTMLLVGGALCNDALLECEEDQPGFRIVGDPTEGALVVAAARVGLTKEKLEAVFPRVSEVPFDSERKRMTTMHRLPDSPDAVPAEMQAVLDWAEALDKPAMIAFTKGSVDGLLEISDRVWDNDHTEPIGPDWRKRIENSNTMLAANGMRVLGVAVRGLDGVPASGEDPEQQLIFVGVTGMIDPARPEVKQAVETCRLAGIRPMMITGDHPLTAGFIARELGFDVNGQILTGQQLEAMSEADLSDTVSRTSVYARVSPEHKLKIVQALQNQGEIAAMTGDGVNDAPALRKADIGVAMGITGTDVSKEASDMVLLDDNFATIVAAVEEGRVIYDNIRRFIKYLISCNSGEVGVMLLGPLLGMPLPLLPLQILWMNLVTDGLPALALGVEKPERNVMRRAPYPPGQSIFARGLGRDVILYGLFMTVLTLAVGYSYWRADPNTNYWQTMTFTTLTFAQMMLALAVRSERDSFFSIGPFTNLPLIGAVSLTFLLQLAVIYLPLLQGLFETVSLSPVDLGLAFLLSTLVFWAVEVQKWFIRRRS